MILQCGNRALGGNYGSGWRSGGVSTLICAVLDDRRVTDDEEPRCVSVLSLQSTYHRINVVCVGIAVLCGLVVVFHTQTTSGSAKGLGSRGEPKTRISIRFRGKDVKTKVTVTLNRRSKSMDFHVQRFCGGLRLCFLSLIRLVAALSY